MRNRGTFRPDRHGSASRYSLVTPNEPPIPPAWLTPTGRKMWQSEAPRAFAAGFASEADSNCFGNFANLLGAIVDAWGSGGVPPATYMAEARRMAEQFGLAGVLSRVTKSGREPPR